MHTITIKEKVANTVRWLDERAAGPNSSVPANWRELVDVNSLQLESGYACVAGQIFKPANRGKTELDLGGWRVLSGFSWAVKNFGVADQQQDGSLTLYDAGEVNEFGKPIRTIESRFLGFTLSDREYPNYESHREAWRKLQDEWVRVLIEEKSKQ
jgi:hypothetical protein